MALTDEEYEKIPEGLKREIVEWFEKHARKKTARPYAHVKHKKVTRMYNEMMESIEEDEDAIPVS